MIKMLNPSKEEQTHKTDLNQMYVLKSIVLLCQKRSVRQEISFPDNLDVRNKSDIFGLAFQTGDLQELFARKKEVIKKEQDPPLPPTRPAAGTRDDSKGIVPRKRRFEIEEDGASEGHE